jgi:predicted acyltransferase
MAKRKPAQPKNDAPPPAAPPDAAPAAPRQLALDAFRGLTILLMLLVNNMTLDRATPEQLKHAAWGGGVHVADFVAPWFLLAMGVSIPFALAAQQRKGLPAWRTDLKLLWRAAALVLLGCLLESATRKTLYFSMGVLQLIGLAYLCAALLAELPTSRRALIAGGLLAAYWAALRFLAVPGTTGIFDETHNLMYFLNLTFFGSVHVGVAEVQLWGITSVVPTAALALIGTCLGDVLRAAWRPAWKAAALALLGAALMAGGWAWSWHLFFSKALWTPAYILVTAGAGAALLALFFLLIDLPGWRAWPYPLLVFGANAILAYVAPILVKLLILREWTVPGAAGPVPLDDWLRAAGVARYGPVAGGWLYTAGYVVAWWLVLWLLYRKKLFFRV